MRSCALVLAWTMAALASPGDAPVKLRCEYKAEPLGVATTRPRFSWQMEAGNPARRGVRQTGYQVLVSSTRAQLEAGRGDLWNSGKVASAETLHIAYAGAPLTSNQLCWWKVRTWDERGTASGWSAPARFHMALLQPGDWKAKWIEADYPLSTDSNGYRSKPERSPDVSRWVAIDLLKSERIHSVKLYPAKPVDMQPAHPGYLFPVRFRVDVSQSPNFDPYVTVADRTAADFANPGAAPVDLPIQPTEGRYVRLMVTKLAPEDDGNYGFALAEMEVLGKPWPQPLPFHRGGAVATASDSVEEGGWSIEYLNDAITVSQKGHAGKPAPASMFRKGFDVPEEIDHAYAYVSALGLYEFFVNGKRAGRNLLAPEWTDYHKRVQYQTFDVTELLRKGSNAIGILAGEGWYAGRVSFIPGRRYYGDRPRVIAQVQVLLKSGRTFTLASDESWKTTIAGPIRRADIFDGEVYDARMDMPGWSAPAFNEAAWRQAREYGPVTAKLVSQFNEPIQVEDEVRPVSIKQPSPGVWVVDMGQNMVGWLRVRLRGAAGTTVGLRHAEVLESNGQIYTDNLRQNLQGAQQKDVFTLRGTGQDEVFEPHFTYHGFRYVEVTGLKKAPTLDMFTGRVMHTAAERTGSFESSSPFINKLMSNVWWTQIANFMAIPTDCPQRGERAGWMADAQIISQTAMFNVNMAPFYTKWFQDIRDEQGKEGEFAAFAPTPFSATVGGSTPGWSDAGILIPWAAYVNYGDKQLLADQFDAAVRQVELIRRTNPDLIWRKGPSRGAEFGEWLNGDTVAIPNWPKAGATPPMDIFATAFFANSTATLAKIATVLGKTAEAEKYSALASQIKEAFQREFVKPDGRVMGKGVPDKAFVTGSGVPTVGDSQSTYALALEFDLVPESQRKAAFSHMLEALQKYNWRLSTGIHATYRMMMELVKQGRADVAYRLLNNRDVPSWRYMIDQGATTIWERWDGYVEGRGFQSPFMNSFNHCAFGAIGEWIYRNVAGLNPDPEHPGYEHAIIRPLPGGGLTWAKASYDSVRGRFNTSWRITGDTLTLDVTVPPNTTATVYVPTTEANSVMESGRKLSDAPGLKADGEDGNAAVCKLGSGVYHFTSRWRPEAR